MGISELKQELEAYGIDSRVFFERSELIAALQQAREQNHQSYDPSSLHQQPPQQYQGGGQVPTSYEYPSTQRHASFKNRFFQEELQYCNQMSLEQLQNELYQRGISPTGDRDSMVERLATIRLEENENNAASQSNNYQTSPKPTASTDLVIDDDDGYEHKEAELIVDDWEGPRQSSKFETPNDYNPYETVDPTSFSDPRQYYKESGSSAFANGSKVGGIGNMLNNMRKGESPYTAGRPVNPNDVRGR